jgi:phosphoglycolate phosphatase-like HAD superfamily hydrolase
MSTIAIDFDGVLSDYTGWKGRTAPLDPPVEGAIQAIRDYQDHGLEVVIYTTRADSPAAVVMLHRWLREHGLQQKRIEAIDISNKKPPAVVYLDDRAMLFTGKFPTPDEVKAFKTWKGF